MNKSAHWSDCAVHNGPAYAAGPCDCGGLDPAAYDLYCLIAGVIPTPGSLAEFIADGVIPGLVEPVESPTTISARLRASNLPPAHDGMACS